jgi:YbbR domain-containing protein
MQNQPMLRRTILTNLAWFLGALLLAFIVWLFATSQSDPFLQWRLSERVPIYITPDEGLIITNQDSLSTTAEVQLQGPESVRRLLAPDDVIVTADLAGLGPGEHTVPLHADVARQALPVDISPRQITVRLEVLQSELKPVRVEIVTIPPMVYSAGEPVLDLRQIEVSGAESLVSQVTEVLVPVPLAGQRTTYENDMRAVPVDIDGNTVTGVTLDPQTVHVYIAIAPRSDVREIAVQPNIVGQPPEGYVRTDEFDYNPTTIVVSGPPEVLNSLPSVISTTPISLSDKTSSFEVTVPIELPDEQLDVITGRSITVQVGITTQTITRQFDQIPVEFVGGRDGLAYSSVTDEVTVLVTGPQPLLDQLNANDLSVVVDVSTLNAGSTASLTTIASILESGTAVTTSVLPAQVDVEARSATETTAEPTTEPSGG